MKSTDLLKRSLWEHTEEPVNEKKETGTQCTEKGEEKKKGGSLVYYAT